MICFLLRLSFAAFAMIFGYKYTLGVYKIVKYSKIVYDAHFGELNQLSVYRVRTEKF